MPEKDDTVDTTGDIQLPLNLTWGEADKNNVVGLQGRMHAARLDRSPRLQRVLAALQAAGPGGITTRELSRAAEVYAAGTFVSELRKNGVQIACAMERTTADGARVYRYRLQD